jgi:hypothetical protein
MMKLPLQAVAVVGAFPILSRNLVAKEMSKMSSNISLI